MNYEAEWLEELAAKSDAKLRFGGPGVMWPHTKGTLPDYKLDWSHIRPIWRAAPDPLLRMLLDPVTFWILVGTYEGEPIKFDHWQIAWLRNHNRFRAVEKAPQIGFSWLSAMEALHECLIFTDTTCGFVSVDMREATEKVLYARKAYFELPAHIQTWVPLLRDAVDQLDFGDEGRRSRLMSLPATAGLRGRRMSVYLDEADFYKDGGREVFRAAMGRIARGGRITIGSTCFGVDTMLDRVMQGDERVFSRARLPWTVVENEDMMNTIEMALAELDAEDAAEEYECLRGGATTDTFPPKLIVQQTHDLEFLDPEVWEPSGVSVAGFDVGKTRHPSILSVFEQFPDKVWRQVVLYQPKKPNGDALTLPAQHEWLRGLMKQHKNMRLCLDVAGIGAQIGQAMEAEFGSRFISMYPGSRPHNLPTQDKGELVTELKRGLEARELELGQDRDQALQFRRTRRKAGSGVEQPGSARRTHYDRFWASAYAWYAAGASRGAESVYSRKKLTVIGAEGTR